MSDIFVDEKGNMSPLEPKNGRAYSLKELQEKVGGLIELVDVGKYYVVLNEEGKIRHMQPNFLATMWLNDAGHNDVAVGPAMLIGKERMKNDTD